jgi:hypothetical protein
VEEGRREHEPACSLVIRNRVYDTCPCTRSLRLPCFASSSQCNHFLRSTCSWQSQHPTGTAAKSCSIKSI